MIPRKSADQDLAGHHVPTAAFVHLASASNLGTKQYTESGSMKLEVLASVAKMATTKKARYGKVAQNSESTLSSTRDLQAEDIENQQH